MRRYAWWWGFALGTIIGIVFGVAFYHFPNVKVKAELNVADLLNLGTTVLLAVFVPFTLVRGLERRRRIGESLRSELSIAWSSIQQAHDTYIESLDGGIDERAQRRGIIARLKKASAEISQIRGQLEATQVCSKRGEVALEALSTSLLRYKKRVTAERMPRAYFRASQEEVVAADQAYAEMTRYYRQVVNSMAD